jgi:hypothetical protein
MVPSDWRLVEEMEGGSEGMDRAGSVEERRGRRTVGRGRQEGKEIGEAAGGGRGQEATGG